MIPSAQFKTLFNFRLGLIVAYWDQDEKHLHLDDCGHEEVSSGEILLGESVINELPRQTRYFNDVSNYVLFPHLNCIDNVAFPLKMRGTSKAIRHTEAAKVLSRCKCWNLETASKQLSGANNKEWR